MAAPARRAGGRHTTPTSRAAVLALVLCALVVMLADPLRTYLGQRGQIARQRTGNSALQHRVDTLQAQERLWQDPNFVRQQARQRLYFVMPGETPYVVVGGSPVSPEPPAGAGPDPTTPSAAQGATWYARLWSSVEAAGTRPAGTRPR